MKFVQNARFCSEFAVGVALALLTIAASVSGIAQTALASEMVSDSADDTQHYAHIGTNAVIFSVEGQLESDLDQQGDFNLITTSASGYFDVELTDRVHILTIADYRAMSYDFDDTGLSGGVSFVPWSTTHAVRFSPLVEIGIDSHWSLHVGPLLEVVFESEGDIGRSVKQGGLAAATYVFADGTSISLGVVGVHDLGKDFYLQPVLGLDWRPIDEVRVHINAWTTRGGEIEVAWRAIDQLEIAAKAGYRRERFRLDDRVLITPGSPPTKVDLPTSKGVGEDRAYTAAGRISFYPRCDWLDGAFSELRLDFEAGAVVWGKILVEDKNRNSKFRSKYDPVPFFRLGFVYPLGS